RFGPPRSITFASPCSWQAHPASGRTPALNCRAIHARFHCASVGLPLRQRTKVHSPAHSSIGTPSPRKASTPCRCMVSDLFHSPLRGSFHLSLTVLVHYRSLEIFSLRS